MTLQVLPCTPNDLPRAFETISLAFAQTDPYINTVYPSHDTPAGRAAGAHRLLLAQQSQPWAHFCKAIDPVTNEAIGFAKWDVYDGVLPDVPKRLPAEYYENEEERVYAEYMVGEFTRRRWDAVRGSEGKIVSLDVMAVDPAYHRRGAGSRLMEYGVEIADKLGFEAVVEASRMGRYLYEKFGFQILEDVLIKNPPAQKDRPEEFIYWMWRPAKKAVDADA